MPYLIVIIAILFSILSKKKSPQTQSEKKKHTVPAATQPSPKAKVQKSAKAVSPASDVIPEGVSTEPIRPTVHVTPHDHTHMFQGSMDHDQTEGVVMDMPSDHSDELFAEAEPIATTPERNPLHFCDNELINAVILQEVLKRPGARRAS